ncbi:hypothetical protein OGH69_06470 [Flavobacterium sp. MFBS3-15]|uniref:hypothetical protein n=1 Tax=Flavobacterium sp. MFBS3-15 TaxID=2989816 RepID=UPI0022362B2F|nr:hypothetical protein [Flavobacterium sp. MFBS3-15]MCW4468598.1 hypothetical protein [Flavobacterium sp. MFBS3-15]
MDLQARKLSLIEYLINLKDEQVFNKIEAIAKNNSFEKEDYLSGSFSEDEMIARAEIANEDYAAGRIMTLEQLEAEVKNW